MPTTNQVGTMLSLTLLPLVSKLTVLAKGQKGNWEPKIYTLIKIQHTVPSKWKESHLCSWSGVWLLVIDEDPVLPLRIPLSTGGAVPHLPSASVGSITLTEPSVSPTANWLASCGWAATTSGYTAWLLQIARRMISHRERERNKYYTISIASS